MVDAIKTNDYKAAKSIDGNPAIPKGNGDSGTVVLEPEQYKTLKNKQLSRDKFQAGAPVNFKGTEDEDSTEKPTFFKTKKGILTILGLAAVIITLIAFRKKIGKFFTEKFANIDKKPAPETKGPESGGEAIKKPNPQAKPDTTPPKSGEGKESIISNEVNDNINTCYRSNGTKLITKERDPKTGNTIETAFRKDEKNTRSARTESNSNGKEIEKILFQDDGETKASIAKTNLETGITTETLFEKDGETISSIQAYNSKTKNFIIEVFFDKKGNILVIEKPNASGDIMRAKFSNGEKPDPETINEINYITTTYAKNSVLHIN